MTAFEAFLAHVERVDPADDAAFKKLLNEAVIHLGLSHRRIAHAFSASRPTVERWLSGESAPHPAMRKAVYSWLVETWRRSL